MATTKENLEAAFAGESQAFQKYTNFADKAEKDGARLIVLEIASPGGLVDACENICAHL